MKDILSIVPNLVPPWLLLCEKEHIDSKLLHAKIDLHGGLIRELDGHKMKTLDSLYDQLAQVFEFPEYFGKNFNALEECITDLEWMTINGPILLLIHDADMVLLDSSDDSLCGFIEVLNDAGNSWRLPVGVGEFWDRPAYPFHVALIVTQARKSLLLSRIQHCTVQLGEACG